MIAELSEQMERPAPPVLRQEQERGLVVAMLALRVASEDENDWTDGLHNDLRNELHNFPRPLKGAATFLEASQYVHVRTDVEPWQVWIRRDEIPSAELLKTVEVLAKLWTDIVKARPLGTPDRRPRARSLDS
ncbi:MAG: hypothetical protein ABIZ52_07230 [Candidatus Limnocylindrales bacterium]